MLDRFDQAELLELVEGELRADRAAAITRKLAGDLRAVEYLETLKTDRKQLQAVDHPQVPVDFFTQLEPLLARPMLMEPIANLPARPGSFRRMHRRKERRQRLRRYGIAALIALSLLGGIWAATQQFRPRGGDGLNLARNPDADSSATAIDPAWPPAGSTVHHQLPRNLVNALAAGSPGVPAVNPSAVASSPRLIVADFAVVLVPQQGEAVESILDHAVASVDPHIALVRNFSFSEAQRLVRDWRMANAGGNSPSRDVAASTSQRPADAVQPDIRTLAERVREHVSKLAAGRDGRGGELASAHLRGATTSAPSLEQQLDLSSRGAAYTIGVPPEKLVELVQQLNSAEKCTVALRMLPEASGPFESTSSPPASNVPQTVSPASEEPLELWVAEGGAARAAVHAAAQAEPGSTVLIAVIIGDPPATGHQR